MYKIKYMEQINDWQDYATVYGEKLINFLPALLSSLLILLFGWWVIKIIVRYVKKIFVKKDYDKSLENFVLTILNYGLKILLFIVVISQLGVETTSLIAIVGALVFIIIKLLSK